MNIEIINTGSELLLGTTVNTHAAWIGSELIQHGLRVQRQSTVPDGDAIIDALQNAMSRSDAVIVTGGIGPTSDDLSREAAAQVLGVELVQDQRALKAIELFFSSRQRRMASENRKQANKPEGSLTLANPNGTAPGIYISQEASQSHSCALFLLPGPTGEMRPMFHAEVLPRLIQQAGSNTGHSMKTLRFTGIGESDFHAQLDSDFLAIPDLEIGYCARPSEVDLRLIGSSDSITKASQIALKHFATECFSADGESLEARVVYLLNQQGKKLAIAESCTGGRIASRITDVSGSSSVFTHGYVTYANAAKCEMLGVPEAMINDYGAVSKEVALAMAQGARQTAQTDIAVSVTGIAGPTGGCADKPVGTVWIGISTAERSLAIHKCHAHGREFFKQAASQNALDLIRRSLLELLD